MIWHFGLPNQPSESTDLLDSRLPVHITTWQKDGIRYTQTVLLSTLDEPPFNGHQEVLLVQLAGENIASEYTDADVRVSVRLNPDGEPMLLRLDSGLVRVGPGEAGAVVAAIVAPAESIDSTEGMALGFHGHMPPGTSGNMVIAIPLAPIRQTGMAEALTVIDFDAEFRKVRRAWKRRLPLPSPQPSWVPH
jgi:hypothetical protein